MNVRAVLAIGLLALGPVWARADAVDQAMLEAAPKVIAYLQSKGCKNAGVLKFRVERGKEAATLNAGVLNARLAAALRHALVLLDDDKAPIGILDDPGKVLPRGTYLTVKGRRELLAQRYPLCWGDREKDRATPDILLTGTLSVAKDLESADLIVRAFTKDEPEQIREVTRVNIPRTDRALLAGIGQAFAVPRARSFSRDDEVDRSAVESAAKTNTSKSIPLQAPDSPIKLEVYFGQAAPARFDVDPVTPGSARLRRPRLTGPAEGQEVKFMLQNTSQEQLAVLVAVNGENTLYRQKISQGEGPRGCTKWVLDPGDRYEIKGYYIDSSGTNLLPFRALSKDESAVQARELAATIEPDLVGHVSVFVFQKLRENMKIAVDTSLANDLEPRAALGPPPRTLSEAQERLQKTTRVQAVGEPGRARKLAMAPKSRELIAPAPAPVAGATLVRVPFVADPQPVFALHIRYYDPPAEIEETSP